jgi:hypothetical protein
MKLPSLIAGIAVLVTASSLCRGQDVCRATVEARVEISGGELTLSDLLTRDSCARLRTAAAAIRLGSAPLEGSARVFPGGEIRERLQAIAPDASSSFMVPERITVRHAGARASCAEIEAKLLSATPSAKNVMTQIDCGAAGRIPLDAPLQRTGKIWDPATRTWLLQVRCVHAADCVPFAVRVPADAFPPTASREPDAVHPAAKPLVRPGQSAMLLWDQDGIRAVVPTVCLDSGAAGETIRTRIAHGTQVVRAIVVSARELKAAS